MYFDKVYLLLNLIVDRYVPDECQFGMNSFVGGWGNCVWNDNWGHPRVCFYILFERLGLS